MNSYLVCLIFVAVIAVADANGCRNGWKKHGDKCYKSVTKQQSNAAHKAGCSKLGGYLAEPISQSENTFIRTLITGQSFIGFNDKRRERHFVEDRSGTVPCYTNWNKGEPNNYRGREDCTEMYIDKHGVWNDIDCKAGRRAVCEYKDNCKSGWKPFGRRCLKAFPTKKTRSDAARACKTEEGYLAEPQSEEENRLIRSLIKSRSYLGFTGKNKIFKDRAGRCLGYVNWHRGEPNNYRRRENCVEMYTTSSGTWNDISCHAKFSYVCEYQLY